MTKMFNIWSTDWIQRSSYEGDIYSPACLSDFADLVSAHSSFGFLRLLDLSPGEAHFLHVMPLITRRLIAIEEEMNMVQDSPYSLYVLLTMCLDDLLTRSYQRRDICSTYTCQLIPHQSIAPLNLLGWRQELTRPLFAVYVRLGSLVFISPWIEMVRPISGCARYIIVLHGQDVPGASITDA